MTWAPLTRAAACGLWLIGCSAAEGPLLHARSAMPPAGGGDGGAAGGGGSGGSIAVAQPVPLEFSQGAPWQYQLTGAIDETLEAELFVVDLFNTEQPTLDEHHARGRLDVAYLSAGTHETFRDDADQFPAAAVGSPLDSYPNERWLDVRDPTVRSLMAARLDLAASKGFEGVLPTSMTAYRADSGFALSADDQLDYTTWLAAEVRARGMSAGMSGDFGRSAELAAHHDFAIHFGCLARGDCAVLAPFAAAAKPVFDIETEGEPASVCAAAAQQGVNVLMKDSGFGPDRVGCP